MTVITKPELLVHHPMGHPIDVELLKMFELALDPANPEHHAIPSHVLGYGEISTVFEIDDPAFAGFALKRISIFETAVELEAYLQTYNEYHWLLEDEIGIRLPLHGYVAFRNRNGRFIFYIVQQKVDSKTIGHKLLATCDMDEATDLFTKVLAELHKLHLYNQSQNKYQVTLDGQISNWAADADELLYIDTSTPLYRIHGEEQLNSELFLRPAPSFLRWVLRIFFLEDVVNRYYDLRQVMIDLLGNLYKEQLPHLVPPFISIANQFLEDDLPDLGHSSITEEEVMAYYKEDKQIWSLYASSRRLDRFLQTQILRKQYPYILPGKVQR